MAFLRLENGSAWPLWLLILIAAPLRLAMCFLARLPNASTDTQNYLDQARAIRSGGWIDFFPNGFPLLLAALPLDIGSPAFVAAALVLNCALSVGIVVFVYLILVRLLDRVDWAFLGALLVALWPNQLNYARLVMSEVPTAFFLCLAAYFLVTGRFATAGFALGIACIMRTSILPAALLVLVWLLWTPRAVPRFLACLLVPILAIAVLSFTRTGHFSLGGNFVTNVVVAQSSFGVPAWVAGDTSGASLTHGLHLYFSELVEQPGTFFVRRLLSAWELWGPFPLDDGQRSPIARAIIGLRFPLFAAALAVVLFPAWRRRTMPILLILIGVSLVHIGLFSTPRFSFVLEPLAMVLAVVTAAVAIGRVQALPPAEARAAASVT